MWYLVQALWRAKETFSASLADIDDFRYPSRAIRGIDRISLCESMARACSTVGAAINPSQIQTDPLPNGSGDGQGRARDIHFPGTALKWIGRRDAWSGIANVYIDGVLKPQVDAGGRLSRASRIGARPAPNRPCAGGLSRYFEPDLPLLSLVRTGGRSAFADAGGTAGAIRVRSEFDFSRSIASARPFFGAVVTFDCARARTRTRMLMVGSMTIVSTSPTETLAASRRSRSMMMKKRFHRYPM